MDDRVLAHLDDAAMRLLVDESSCRLACIFETCKPHYTSTDSLDREGFLNFIIEDDMNVKKWAALW